MIAALYVQKGGAYFGLTDVDPWDEARDARLYAGPWRVVAHPPCQRWCQLAGLNQSLFGYRVGDDGGCFAAALASVRRFGGVLEHPAFSLAWKAHDLHEPSAAGGWINADFKGGWTCHVEQGHYGHRARKATWLYAVSPALPALRWGPGPKPTATVSNMRNHGGGNLERIVQRRADASPTAFRDALLAIARGIS